MIVAHNLSAMNAQRQFNIVARSRRKSMEKLSSGYRINRAADGALAEVNDMLHRMTELSVKAANGTNTFEDRKAIQSEINANLAENTTYSESTIRDANMA